MRENIDDNAPMVADEDEIMGSDQFISTLSNVALSDRARSLDTFSENYF